MKIDSERLRSLRKEQKLSLVKLAEKTKRVNPPGITEKTIQRLEAPSQQNTTVREHTVESLTKALKVDVGVLTGELPLPESDKVPADNPDRVPIGAQIAPKTRLAYDLIKRRYGVSVTEIINAAPLFFALLAERSLVWRHEKLKEAKEAVKRLHQTHAEIEHRIFGLVADYGDEAYTLERDSIAKADIFGDYRYEDRGYTINSIMNVFFDEPFDPEEDNPFASYLRKLANKPAIRSVVDVDGGVLNIASDFKFPHYEICREELNHITNGSEDAKRTLETGCARIAEIPEKLMAEDAGEKRAKWLENKLLHIYKKMDEKSGDMIATGVVKDTSGKWKKFIEEYSEHKKKETTNE